MATSPRKKQDFEVSAAGPDHSISYPSEGPVLNEQGQRMTNDHSVLTKVAGKEVWLHHERHHHADGRVHMPMWSAKDAGLPTPDDIQWSEPDEITEQPGSANMEATKDQLRPADKVTQQSGGAGGTTHPAAPSKLDHEPREGDRR